MATDEKCAHPPCDCRVTSGTYGKYCSAFCQSKGETADVTCDCGHPNCR